VAGWISLRIHPTHPQEEGGGWVVCILVLLAALLKTILALVVALVIARQLDGAVLAPPAYLLVLILAKTNAARAQLIPVEATEEDIAAAARLVLASHLAHRWAEEAAEGLLNCGGGEWGSYSEGYRMTTSLCGGLVEVAGSTRRKHL